MSKTLCTHGWPWYGCPTCWPFPVPEDRTTRELNWAFLRSSNAQWSEDQVYGQRPLFQVFYSEIVPLKVQMVDLRWALRR